MMSLNKNLNVNYVIKNSIVNKQKGVIRHKSIIKTKKKYK